MNKNNKIQGDKAKRKWELEDQIRKIGKMRLGVNSNTKE